MLRPSSFKGFAQSISGGGFVKKFNAKSWACLSQGEMKQLEEATWAMRVKGLVFNKAEDGQWKSPILKV
jgi:hypothetical protein